LRFPCKVFPLPEPHPAFPKQQSKWAPIVNVRLSRQHSPPTRTIECWIDSGADVCIFHAGICHSLGINRVEDGIRDELHGVIGDLRVPMYFHKVRILIFGDSFETMAGFSHQLSVTGLLGLRGFFENFVVTIDSSVHPPHCEIEKIHRA
jgi:hypothetical protein